ncbi:DUF3302 domain-containing protein [Raoultella ornithinolytica]|uniref:DUF3302 domain-containing protein n=1 Tax=Raoultella ornithinolytica TaxID=54291 RepID=UPI00135E495F|nr:DUF3302 domain-containing protein [Raoultella ornithinolytica]MCF6626658.1 DUF3302 domain-containing protein [Raoultella ornithinolytica]MCF6642637.1 DUF3302 domain-containing protein [Raoultella ornithinolytica]MCF6647028.1 DUF3302 domain-containing protein [Raoultella ornithinolytica]MCF6662672.1 DUF3302 domain-containing protein [Raoultella ornithinolytica]MCF6677135.1 DUF3302 domain-containing protein [Raoultella ornithinolytica]
MTLDYVALAILVAVALILFYGVIVIHDIPYEIAKKRNHPHQDAIHYAGWVSLFTLHILWPLLWIWATLWREDRGWGMQKMAQEQSDLHHRLEQACTRLDTLQQELNAVKQRAAVNINNKGAE